MTEPTFTVAGHFEGKDPAVRATYTKLPAAVKKFGKVREEPKKTLIHRCHPERLSKGLGLPQSPNRVLQSCFAPL